jgi:PilZ domain
MIRTPPAGSAGESRTLESQNQEPQNQPATSPVRDAGEARRKPRFKLAVDISIHSESCGLLRGRSLDISEIGLGAVLGEDLPLGEIVKLNIPLPSGPLAIAATVRQRSSFFRHGFEFIESNSVREILESTCRQLAVRQTLTVSSPSSVTSWARSLAQSDFLPQRPIALTYENPETTSRKRYKPLTAV